MEDDIRREIMTKLTVSVPVAGKALGLGRNAAYDAARRGDIPTIDLRGKKKPVPTAPLRRMLGIESGEAA
jgi:hypothetical protein